jgi:hypothetical protein
MALAARSLSWLGYIAGIAAAIAAAQLIPRLGDIGGLDFLRALYALIEAWRALAASVGAVTGLSGDVVTIALFAATVAIPVAIGLAWMRPPQQLAYVDPSEYHRMMSAHHAPWAPLMKGFQVLILGFIFLALYAGAVAPDLMDQLSTGNARFGSGPFFLVFAPVTAGGAYLLGLVILRGYLAGLIIVVALLITAQVLYWFNAPWIADCIRALTEPAAI